MSAPLMSFANHLKSAKDLVTSYEETRAGFISLALERNKRSSPFIDEARALQARAQTVKKPQDLLQLNDIRSGLISAAGVSDKAAGHLGVEGIDEAIKGLIETFLEPAGPKFVEELVFRYLLTRGDTLGGTMRNIIGFLSQRKLNTAIAAALKIAGVPSFFLGAGGKNWSNTADAEQDEIALARGLSWTVGAAKRTLLYNIKVPQIGSNVDLCLFNCECKSFGEKVLTLNDSFVALGELKGGIDPAGADEHWKTARSALMRIRNNFSSQTKTPLLFFIGAAIEQRMGTEIWSELQSGQLNNAANLTKPAQVASLCNWLITI